MDRADLFQTLARLVRLDAPSTTDAEIAEIALETGAIGLAYSAGSRNAAARAYRLADELARYDTAPAGMVAR